MTTHATQTDAVVRTPAGDVRGSVLDGGIRRFLGIPFAEPPQGDLRFAAPVPRRPWSGEHDATRAGAVAGQRLPASGGGLEPHPGELGEDYLNLNVWTPAAPSTGNGHPVMVFIHGGAFVSGSGSLAGYDGARFARDGVVLVTLNYRLGAEGFSWFGDGAANLGLRDQICALQWVRDSVATFGGDPDNITVFGESAGAMSIGALLANEEARALFRRAILQSGSVTNTQSPAATRRVSTLLARMLRVPASREGLARVDAATLLAAQTRISPWPVVLPLRSLWGDAAAHKLPFAPTIDGDLLRHDPLDAVRSGAADDVDLLLGWNREEGNLFLASGGLDRIPAWLMHSFRRIIGLPARRLRAYREAHPDYSPGQLMSALLTDWYYRIPAIRTAEAHPRAHLYEFTWRSPAYDGHLGAGHAVDLPFVFDNLDSPDWAGLIGDAAPQAVADDMHAAWVAFARDGDPGWGRYSTDRREVRVFGESSGVVVDPDAATRRTWAGIR